MTPEELETLDWAADILSEQGFVKLAGQLRDARYELSE